MVTIAIGTKKEPKINAVVDVFENSPYFEKNTKFDIFSENVDTGVSDMPLNLDETILGAKNRVQNLKKIKKSDWYVGLEGGCMLIGDIGYLFGVVYIENDNNEGHIGISSMIELPSKISKEIFLNGKELGPLMSELAGKLNVGNKNGTYGELTDDLLTRKSQFEKTTICTLSPFFNKFYK